MTSLFALIFLGAMNTAEARPHHHPPPKAHAAHRHVHHAKPAPVKSYHLRGHRYYRDAGFVWRWASGRWIDGRWARGHWEISYRI